MDEATERVYRKLNRLQNALARWGRHDFECPAHGRCNCDKSCTCGLRSVSLDTGASRNARVTPASVTIEVRGGVAHVASAPHGVEVEIVDYDNLEAEAEANGK